MAAKTYNHIKDLKPDRKNARRHNPRNIGTIVSSLQEVGAARSIVIDEAGNILAGNGTIEAAAEAGITKLQVVDADGETIVAVRRKGLTRAQKVKLAVADNRTAELADWDAEILKELSNEADLSQYFYDGEIDALLAQIENNGNGEPSDAEPQIDRAAELNKKWKVKTDDLFVIGEHRLLCGDSTKAEDVARVVGGEKCRLAVTSPPYNQKLNQFTASGMHAETKWISNIQSGSYFDSRDERSYQIEQSTALKLWASVLTDDGSIFYNHKNRYREKEVVSPWRWIGESGAKCRQEIIWKREGSVTQNARMFMPCDERIFWLYFGSDFYFNDSTEHKTWSSVWQINSYKDTEDSLHGCAFPLEIALRPILACTETGNAVLEPYCGSGSTMVAAQNLNRKCYAIEISPNYCAVILQRMEDAFGITGIKVK